MQFCVRADGLRARPEVIAILASPEPIFQNHIDAERQGSRSDIPLHGFDSGAFCVVEAVPDYAGHPLIWGQAKGGQIPLQLPGEGRLAGTGKPAY